MTNELPKFEKGQRLTARDMQALAQAVASLLRNGPGFGYGVPRGWYCRLDGDLASATATNWNTSSAPTATVSLYAPNISGALEDSGQDEIVRNRTDIAYASGTMGFMVWFDEWVFFGNCNPF